MGNFAAEYYFLSEKCTMSMTFVRTAGESDEEVVDPVTSCNVAANIRTVDCSCIM